MNKARKPKHIYRVVFIMLIFMIAGGVSISASKTRHVSAQTLSTCLNRVNILVEDMHWTYIPESPEELHTEERYSFLAGQLIEKEIVDASTCPAGGLMLNGYANACGMAKAMPAVIIIQNMMNEPILKAYEDVGVPPVLLKQLISTESQFWPSQHSTYHYGFGHITNLGLLNALQWNPDLYAKLCPEGVCTTDIGTADQILSSLISTCETCEYGIDPEAANRSVDILAEVLLGYCYQTEQLILNATGWHSSLAVDYATIWKLTLMDYNAGSQCVYNTIYATFQTTQGPMDWDELSAHVSGSICIRGLYYANQITAKTFDFPPGD